MTALVTGVAGFIGSHIAEALVARGERVAGVDAFTDYYAPELKRRTAVELAERGVAVSEVDLRHADLAELIEHVDVIFHCAAQPGVRASWDERFGTYVEQNVLVTQRLLEACRRVAVQRFVYSSSSSIYGNAATYPTFEDQIPAPISPYGVTKLAGEHLCSVYAANFGIPTVSLRYFTVYGPRQRPDMATWRLVDAALNGGSFPMFGDGSQVRDFTYVGDVVRANLAAGERDVPPGTIVNVAGGGSTTLREVIDAVEACTGHRVDIDRRPTEPGDVVRTGGSVERARQLLGWAPEVGVAEGVARQVEWQRVHHSDRPKHHIEA